MPYPNEHAARLKDPNQFKRIRRQNDKFGSGIHVIWGITDDDKAVIQAIRFDKSKFTPSQARKWLTDNDYNFIEFEEASNAFLNLEDEWVKSEIANAIQSKINNGNACMAPTPGTKYRSDGKGKGKMYGQGKGPIGIPKNNGG